jgi:translation initiation factor 2 gamma subunit (eIF-2gamma)
LQDKYLRNVLVIIADILYALPNLHLLNLHVYQLKKILSVQNKTLIIKDFAILHTMLQFKTLVKHGMEHFVCRNIGINIDLYLCD